MKKVIRDGKVAVLYSPQFGAGWYSWNREHKELLFLPELVEMIEAEKTTGEMEALIKSNPKYENVYCGGLRDITIEWLPEGTAFQIDEYDGSESISIRDMQDWIIA